MEANGGVSAHDFLSLVKVSPRGHYPNELIFAFDPGETTGFSIWRGGELLEAHQLQTKTIQDAWRAIEHDFLDVRVPDRIVMESYHIYKWRTEQHTWSAVHTLQLIGGIKMLAIQWTIPVYEQTAQVAKNFATDNKLKAWNFWLEGKPHARDSIRHACNFLLFGPKPE
jgi:hypothetical protein